MRAQPLHKQASIAYALQSPIPLAAGAYIGGALLTLLVARLAFGPAVGLRAAITSGHVVAGLAVAAGLGAWVQGRLAPARFWQLVWALVLALALAAIVAGAPLTRAYGDSEYLLARVGSGTPVAKWLAGTALADWLHAAVWEFPPAAAALPPALAAPAGFWGAIGALAMAVAALWILQRWPDRLAAVLPMLTPIWLMLAAGYLEYYPLIAGALLGALLWLLDGRLAERSPRAVGLVIATLPLLYIGFIPLSALIAAAYALAAPRRLLPALGWALIGFAALAAVLWPAGVADYLRTMNGQYMFGEAFTDPRYRGQVAGEHSIFFRAGYALSAARLREVAAMYFWAGGLLAPPVLLGCAAYLARAGRLPRRLPARTSRLWAALALLAWQGFYLLFMIPKLGPVRDIDLFFAAYLTVALLAGLAADAALPPAAAGRARVALCAAVLGSTAISSLFLMRLGLPGLS